MKKKYFLLFILLGIVLTSFGQIKIVKYCEIMATEGLRDKAGIYINYGNTDSLFSFKDSTIKSNMKKVEAFRTVPDALNYMASLGWTLVTTANAGTAGSLRFFFKKEFEKSELRIIE